MFLVDSNIFLEVLLQQSRVKECRTFMEFIETNDVPVICTQYTVHSIAAILSRYHQENDFADFVENIERMKALIVYSTSLEEEKQIARRCRELKLDFDDALQYRVAKSVNCQAIISLDSDFDKTDLKRLTPEQFFSQYSKK